MMSLWCMSMIQRRRRFNALIAGAKRSINMEKSEAENNGTSALCADDNSPHMHEESCSKIDLSARSVKV